MPTNGVEIMATHCKIDIIRPLVGVQVLQYCVPLYVRDDPKGSNESGAFYVSTCTESVGADMNKPILMKENIKIGIKGKNESLTTILPYCQLSISFW